MLSHVTLSYSAVSLLCNQEVNTFLSTSRTTYLSLMQNFQVVSMPLSYRRAVSQIEMRTEGSKLCIVNNTFNTQLHT